MYLPCAYDADEVADNYRGPFRWPRFSSMSYRGRAEKLLRVVEGRGGMSEDRPQLLRLLHRYWYCDGCRAAEEAPGWGQRVERVRIGYEGYLRICGHEQGIIRWLDVLDIETKTGVVNI